MASAANVISTWQAQMHKRFIAWLLVLFLIVMVLTAAAHAAQHLHHSHDYKECQVCFELFKLPKAAGRQAAILWGFLFLLYILQRFGLKAANMRPSSWLSTPVSLKVKLTN